MKGICWHMLSRLYRIDLHMVKEAPQSYTASVSASVAKVSDTGPLMGLAAVLAMHIADVETAQYDLKACQCRETNPLSRNRWIAYGVGVPFDVVGFVWARRSHRDHPSDSLVDHTDCGRRRGTCVRALHEHASS